MPGRLRPWCLVSVLLVAAIPALASAQGVSVTLPRDIEFKAPFTGYPGVANLYGDPAKPGLFVQQVKFPPGFKLLPHWHPEDVRTIVVLSGTLYYANGERWDESKLKPFPPGTFFSEPPMVPHYAWAKDGEVVLQLTGIGPSGTTMIEQPKK